MLLVYAGAGKYIATIENTSGYYPNWPYCPIVDAAGTVFSCGEDDDSRRSVLVMAKTTLRYVNVSWLRANFVLP